MTVPGYRNTAPPQLFVDFSREALEAIEQGIFSEYSDPLDLRNTLKSFSYSLTKSDTPGAMQITLINPSQQVEEKLFSWYCAVNPRTWRAQQEERTAEEWSASASQFAQFYVRWGYLNKSIDKDPEETFKGLSHIHRVLLYDIKYSISDKQDREVTLLLQNQYDLALLRNSNIASTGTTQTYTVPLTSEPGKLRPIANIIQQAFAILAAGEGTEAHVKLSEPQKQTLNDKFQSLLTTTIDDVGGVQGTIPRLDEATNTVQGGGPIVDCLKQFFAKLNLEVSIESEQPPTEVPVPQASIDQTGVLGGQTDDAQAMERNIANAVQSFNDVTFVFSAFAGGIHQDKNESLLALSQQFIGPAPQPIFPFICVNPYTSDAKGNFKFDMTLAELERMKSEDRILILPLPLPTSPAAGAGLVAIPAFFKENDFVLQREQLAVWEYAENPTDTSGAVENPEDLLITTPANFYRISDDALIEFQLDALISQAKSDRDELIQSQISPNTNQEIQDDIDTIEQNTPSALPPPEPQYIDGNVLKITCSNKTSFLHSLVGRVNRSYFDVEANYVTIHSLDTGVIPEENREEVVTQLGAPVDWDVSKTVVIIGHNNFTERALSFANDLKYINSFNIQVEENPEIISLATGFNQRKDNIITNLQFDINKAGFYTDITRSPAIIQQLYSIAKRFETDPEYRDMVQEVLYFALQEGQEESEGTEAVNSTQAVNTNEFPEEAVDVAFSHVARIVEDLGYDATIANTSVQSSRNILLGKIKDDFAFIRNNELMNAFFPFLSEGSTDSGVARMVVDGEEIQEEIKYRYITESPLELLRTQMSANSEESAVLMAAKLRALANFKSRITDVKLTTLGIPELDMLAYELASRKVALWVSEPRDPGTFHWLSGVYRIINITHKMNPSDGLLTELELLPSLGANTSEELLKASYTFLKKDD